MKKFSDLFLIMLISISVKAQNPKNITILHTNDLHSHLTGFSPESLYTPLTTNDDKTTGGFARIASIIKREKENNSGTTLVLDAGDFLMGTIFQSMEARTGFQLSLMKEMGYDVVSIGNHEFDNGPEMLAATVNSSIKRGSVPFILLGNALFDYKDVRDDQLEKLFNDNIIGRKLIIDRDGLKIGIFSIMGKVAVENAAFAAPVTFSKQIRFARETVKELKEEKCDLIICLSHSGVSKNSDGSWEGEDVELARKVRGISVIISGHTHSKLSEPIIIEGVPIVQTGEYGNFVGKLELELQGDKVKTESFALIPVDDSIEGDKTIHQLITLQEQLVNSEVLAPLNMSYRKPVAESEFLIECNEFGDIGGSNLGPMVADAIHAYVNNHNSRGTDISMVAVGVIRDRIVPGIQTAPDIFRIMSMGSGKDNVPGYPLSRLWFTGKELKSILEILQMAHKSTPANYCYYSGIKVEFNPDKGMFKKIISVEIEDQDGESRMVDFSKKDKTLYSVTANSYMLEFIGIIKKMSFGLINVVPKDSDGNKVEDMKTAVIDFSENTNGLQEGKEWLALMEFIASMEDKDQNGIPEIDKKYSVPVKSFTRVR